MRQGHQEIANTTSLEHSDLSSKVTGVMMFYNSIFSDIDTGL